MFATAVAIAGSLALPQIRRVLPGEVNSFFRNVMDRVDRVRFQVQKGIKGVTTIVEITGHLATLRPANPARAQLEDAVLALQDGNPVDPGTLINGLDAIDPSNRTIRVEVEALKDELQGQGLTQECRIKIIEFHETHLKGERIGTRTDLLQSLFTLLKASHLSNEDIIDALEPLTANLHFKEEALSLIQEIQGRGVTSSLRTRLSRLIEAIFSLVKAQGSPYLGEGIGRIKRALLGSELSPQLKPLVAALEQVIESHSDENSVAAYRNLSRTWYDLPPNAVSEECARAVDQALTALSQHRENPDDFLLLDPFEKALALVQKEGSRPLLEDVAAKVHTVAQKGRQIAAKVGAMKSLLGQNSRGNVSHPIVDLFLAIESVLLRGTEATADVLRALEAMDAIMPNFSSVFQACFIAEMGKSDEEEPADWFKRVVAKDADLLMNVFMQTFELAANCYLPLNQENHIFKELCHEVELTAREHENDPSLGGPKFGQTHMFSRKNPAWTVYAFAKLHNRRRDITDHPSMKLFHAILSRQSQETIIALIDQMGQIDAEYRDRIEKELFDQAVHSKNPLDFRLERWGYDQLEMGDAFETAYNEALVELGECRHKMPDHYLEVHSPDVLMHKLNQSDTQLPGLKKEVLLRLARPVWKEACTFDDEVSFQRTWERVVTEFSPTLDGVNSPWTGESESTKDAILELSNAHPGLFDAIVVHHLPMSGFEGRWVFDHLTDDSSALLRAATRALVTKDTVEALQNAGYMLDHMKNSKLSFDDYMKDGGALNPLRSDHTFEAYAYMMQKCDPKLQFGQVISPPITQSETPLALGLLGNGGGVLGALDRLGGSLMQGGVHFAIGQARSLLETYVTPYVTIDPTTGTPQSGSLNESQIRNLEQAIQESLADLNAAEKAGTVSALKSALGRITPRFTGFDMQVNGYPLPFVGQGIPLAEQGAEVEQAQRIAAQLERAMANRPDADADTADWSQNLNVELPQFTLMSACKTLHKLVYDKFIGLVNPRQEMEEEWALQTNANPGTPEYEAFMQEQISLNRNAYFRQHTDRSFANLMAQLDPTQTVDQQYERFYELLLREIDNRQDIGWRKWAARPYLWGLKRVTHKLMKVVLQNVLYKIRGGLQSWKTEGEGDEGVDRPMPILLFKYITHMFNNFNHARRLIGERGTPEAMVSQVDRMLQTPAFNYGMTPEEVHAELTGAISHTFLPKIDVYPTIDRRLGSLFSLIGRDAITSRAPFMRGVDNLLIKPIKAIFIGVFAILPIGFAWGVKTLFIQPAFNQFLRISFKGGMHFADGIQQVEGVLGDSFWDGTQYQVAIQESIVDLLRLGLEKLQEEGSEGLDIDEIAERQPPWVKRSIAETVQALAHSLKTDGLTQHQLNDLTQDLVGMLPRVARDKVVDIAVENIVKFIVVGYHVAQQDDKMEMIICKLMTNLRTAMRGQTASEVEEERHVDAMSQRSAAAQADIRALMKQIGCISVRKGVVALLDRGDSAHQASAGYAKNWLCKALLNEGPLKRDKQKHRVGPTKADMPGQLQEWDASLNAILEAQTPTTKHTKAQTLASSCLAFSRAMITLKQALAEDDLTAATKREVRESMRPFEENLAHYHREVIAIHAAIAEKNQATSVNIPTKAVLTSLHLIQQKLDIIKNNHFQTTPQTLALLAEVETHQSVVSVQLDNLRERALDAHFKEHYIHLTHLNQKMNDAIKTMKTAMTIEAETSSLMEDLTTLGQRKIEAIAQARQGGFVSHIAGFFHDQMHNVRQMQAKVLGDITHLPRVRRQSLTEKITEIVNSKEETQVTQKVEALRHMIPQIAPVFCNAACTSHLDFTSELNELSNEITAYTASLDAAEHNIAYERIEMHIARAQQLIKRMEVNIRRMKVPGVISARAIDPHSETVRSAETKLNEGITALAGRLLDMLQDPQIIKHSVRCGELALIEGLSEPTYFERRTRMTPAQLAVYI